MVESPDGHRMLIAPDATDVPHYIASTYRFDEVRDRADGTADQREQWMFASASLRVSVHGRPPHRDRAAALVRPAPARPDATVVRARRSGGATAASRACARAVPPAAAGASGTAGWTSARCGRAAGVLGRADLGAIRPDRATGAVRIRVDSAYPVLGRVTTLIDDASHPRWSEIAKSRPLGWEASVPRVLAMLKGCSRASTPRSDGFGTSSPTGRGANSTA